MQDTSAFFLISTLFAVLASCCLNVETSNGRIIGHEAHPGSSVVEFLGIPYAQPPLDKLRFSAPEKYVGNGSYEASHFGFACPQTLSGPSDFPNLTPQAQRIIYDFVGSKKLQQDENCLSLNIWTKEINSGKPKPVLIFFYGGRFASGNTRSPFYSGSNLAQNEDVVVVTINYRVNIFGFPGGPDTEQNLGIQDQRLAVEWLRENVAGFGGDANKLTIWGQSAGGVAVDYWSYAYASDPIVHGFISDSGNAFSFPLNKVEQQEQNWYNVSGAVGCGTSGDTVACMRRKDWRAIKKAVANVPSAPGSSPIRSTPPFYPKVDEKIIFSDYVSLSKSGAFAKVPYLLGNNNHEQGYYVIPAFANGVNATKKEGKQFLLSSFTCPNRFEALHREKHAVPVYRYRYFGHWKNIRLYPGSGAYHGTELEMIFGNSKAVSGIAPSKGEKQTTRLMQHAWVKFADDPVSGLAELGWPQYDSDSKTLAVIALDNAPRIQLAKPSVYDAKCDSVELGSLT